MAELPRGRTARAARHHNGDGQRWRSSARCVGGLLLHASDVAARHARAQRRWYSARARWQPRHRAHRDDFAASRQPAQLWIWRLCSPTASSTYALAVGGSACQKQLPGRDNALSINIRPKSTEFSYGLRWPCDTWPDHFGPPCQATLALIPTDFELAPFRTSSDPGRLRTRAKLLRTTSGETLVRRQHRNRLCFGQTQVRVLRDARDGGIAAGMKC